MRRLRWRRRSAAVTVPLPRLPEPTEEQWREAELLASCPVRPTPWVDVDRDVLARLDELVVPGPVPGVDLAPREEPFTLADLERVRELLRTDGKGSGSWTS